MEPVARPVGVVPCAGVVYQEVRRGNNNSVLVAAAVERHVYVVLCTLFSLSRLFSVGFPTRFAISHDEIPFNSNST